jgi:flagellar motor switch protein FliN/FliY
MSEDAEKDTITADDWAAAMAEQEATEQDAQAQPSGEGAEEDPWAEAMAEQKTAEAENKTQTAETDPNTPPPQAVAQAAQVFQNLNPEAVQPAANNLDLILDIPVNLTVELGRTKIAIRNLLQLAQGSVVELEGLAGEPMDVLVNGYLIAQGEVVVVNDKFGIRLTDIISPAERLRRLNK